MNIIRAMKHSLDGIGGESPFKKKKSQSTDSSAINTYQSSLTTTAINSTLLQGSTTLNTSGKNLSGHYQELSEYEEASTYLQESTTSLSSSNPFSLSSTEVDVTLEVQQQIGSNASSSTSGVVKLSNQLSHPDVVNMLRVDLQLQPKQLRTIQKDLEEDGEYPLNALNGSHLVNAIGAYNDRYDRNKDKEDAKTKMVDKLLEDGKITYKSVAESVAEWLVKTFIDKQQHQYIDPSVIELTKMSIEDQYSFLETTLKINLKNSFKKHLDKPFKLNISDSIKGFYNREGFKERAKELVREDIKHFYQNKTEEAIRQDNFKYGIISNGTGNGKTRACYELQNIILGMTNDEINDGENNRYVRYRKLHSFFAFNNGDSLRVVENEPNNGKIVGLRVLSKILGKKVDDMETDIRFFDQVYQNTGIFELKNIAKQFAKYLDESEVLIWSIAMDEAQNLQSKFDEKWKQPMYSVGRYMVTTDGVNDNLKNNICMIPIICGVENLETMRFKSTEYGNCFFSLPPLSGSNMKEIIYDYFGNRKFKCGKCMISMFKLENLDIIRELSILLYEALIIPQVLFLTLSSIANHLKGETFEKWNEYSSTIFPEMKKKIDNTVEQYLPKVSTFIEADLQQSILEKVLSAATVTLSDKEKDLFRQGRLYFTSHRQLYLPPHYFNELVERDPYISNKLPKSLTNLHPRDFECIDLKCLCYRISYYKKLLFKSVSLEQLFPGSVIGLQKQPSFSLTDGDAEIMPGEANTDDKPAIDTVYKIDFSKCKQELLKMYSYKSTTHLSIDAHFCLLDTATQKKTIFLMQYKNYDVSTTFKPADRLEKGKFAEQAIKVFENENGMNVFFVIITTTSISTTDMKDLKEHQFYDRVILISTTDSQNQYFPPNLLPFYTYVDLGKLIGVNKKK